MENERDSGNVNVTLGHRGSTTEKLLGKQFPCPLCGASMPIRITRKGKPYCHCLFCMLQVFFRGKMAIKRLSEIIESGILIYGEESDANLAITLYNRVQLLKTQQIQLKRKRGLFSSDDDLENTIAAVENEIKSVQGNLEKIARKNSPRGKS